MRLLILIVMVLAVMFLIRTLRLLRYFPPDQRLKMFPQLIAMQVGIGAKNRGSRLNVDSDGLGPSGEPIPVVSWDAIGAATDLVVNPQQVTVEGGYAAICDIDTDGTALIFREGAGADGYTGWLQSRDGTQTEVVRGGVHGTGVLLGGSVENGSVAWMRDDRAAKSVEVWRWDRAVGARVLHRLDYSASGGTGWVSGWCLVAGDITVVTYLPGGVGSIIAHHAAHGVAHIAATSFPTLHRDLAAEARGMRRAGVCMHVAGHARGVVSELDLDTWPPRLVPLSRGPFPGASTQLGKVLGFWDATRVLEIPNAEGIVFPSGSALDPIGNGRWAGFVYAVPSPYERKVLDQSAVVVDASRRNRVTLTKTAGARVYMRGSYVAWHDVTPHRLDDWNWAYEGVNSWVAELNADAKSPRP